MVLFKVPVEEKIPEAPKAAKKPEAVVVPPKEEPTKREKGTSMFLMDLSLQDQTLFGLLSLSLGYVTQTTMIHLNYITTHNILYIMY